MATDYRKLAAHRTACALKWRKRRVAMAALRAGTRRLMAWPHVGRVQAQRSVLWARRAVEEHCA